MRSAFERKRYAVFGEVGIQYQGGQSPSDRASSRISAAAEAADVPLGIHVGIRSAGRAVLSGLLATIAHDLHSPLELEEPALSPPPQAARLHHARGLADARRSAGRALDASAGLRGRRARFASHSPRKEFHRYFERIVEAGFGSRVMFGSDQMNWPGVIEIAIEGIRSAPFLTEAQSRDIFFNNAVPFLRLNPDDISRLH